MRIDDRLPMHTPTNAPTLSMSNANTNQQQNVRLSGSQQPQNQYQAIVRPARTGQMQRGN